MNRHGTLAGRWKALAFGAFWFLVGLWVFRLGWVPVFADAVPTPPSAQGLAALLFGGMLMLAGAILGLVPHFLWLMRAFYKEDFAAQAICPVMVVCPACGVYNQRLRGGCKACGGDLAGARAAGGGAAVRA